MNSTNNFNNTWRKVASVVYKKPVDSKILGTVEVDVTDLENYIVRSRQKGIKITISHVLILTIARALKEEVPELNGYVRRGKIIPRSQIDATVSVLLKGSQMSSVKINNADTLTLNELSTLMAEDINNSRKGSENKTMQSKNLLASIPWPLRGWVFNIYKKLTIGWGISMPALGLKTDSFGSFLLSNIGTFGLDIGYPALFPTSNVSFVMIQGSTNKRPWVVNDQIVPRKILSLSIAMDHRVVDAYHGGLLFRYIKKVFHNPEVLETKPAWVVV